MVGRWICFSGLRKIISTSAQSEVEKHRWFLRLFLHITCNDFLLPQFLQSKILLTSEHYLACYSFINTMLIKVQSLVYIFKTVKAGRF